MSSTKSSKGEKPELVIHERDGRIQDRSTVRNDQNPPREGSKAAKSFPANRTLWQGHFAKK